MAVTAPVAMYMMLATTVATTAYTVDAQNKQADAQEEAQKKNNEAVLKSVQNQYSEMGAFEQEAAQRNLNDSLAVQEDRSRAVGRVNLMSGASGTSGVSMDSMLTDIRQSSGRNMNQINQNRSTDLANFRQQAESIRYGGAGQMDNRSITRPSMVGAGLEIASAAAGTAYGQSAQNAKADSVRNSFGGIYDNTLTGGV